MELASVYMNFRGSVICVRDGAFIHKGIIHSIQIDGNELTLWIIDTTRTGATSAIGRLMISRVETPHGWNLQSSRGNWPTPSLSVPNPGLGGSTILPLSTANTS